MNPHHQWTPAQDRRLAALVAEGLIWSVIATRLGRSESAVRLRWRVVNRGD